MEALMLTQTPAFLESWWWLILAALGLPAALTALLIRRMEKRWDLREEERRREQLAREKKEEERERNRETMERMQIQFTTAAMALAEATAKAVQRIPDAHCNGDMHAALEYAKTVKHERKDFLTQLGVHALHDD